MQSSRRPSGILSLRSNTYFSPRGSCMWLMTKSRIVVFVSLSPALSGPVCPRSFDLPMPTTTSGYLLRSSPLFRRRGETIHCMSLEIQGYLRPPGKERFMAILNLLRPVLQRLPSIRDIPHDDGFLPLPIPSPLPLLHGNYRQAADLPVVVVIELLGG